MNYLTVKQVALRLGLSPQTVRKTFPVTKFGRSVRIWEGELSLFIRLRALSVIKNDPGLSRLLAYYRGAEAVIEHLDTNLDTAADPEMAALLVSSVAACRIDQPDCPMIGVDAVFPPTLAFLKSNLPQGGGEKGDALREMILAA